MHCLCRYVFKRQIMSNHNTFSSNPDVLKIQHGNEIHDNIRIYNSVEKDEATNGR